MSKITLLKGLPASGKSTWAKHFCQDNKKSIRINKDDLRKMFSAHWNHDIEKLVISARDYIAETAIHMGFDNVIIDDTNFAPQHEEKMQSIANSIGCEYEEMMFEAPVEECIKRDLKRADSVGKDVIMDMYRKYVKPLPPIIDFGLSKEPAIIVDIDGTLAHMDGKRSPYDYSKVYHDRCDLPIKMIVNDYKQMGVKIIVVSGRKDDCEDITRQWLEDNMVEYDLLYMRKSDDSREDSIVKEEIYKNFIEPYYSVLFVLDDRDRVVRMWRELGLKCLQVNEGNF